MVLLKVIFMKNFFMIPFRVMKITKVFYLESLELYGMTKLFTQSVGWSTFTKTPDLTFLSRA